MIGKRRGKLEAKRSRLPALPGFGRAAHAVSATDAQGWDFPEGVRKPSVSVLMAWTLTEGGT